jgi:EmrB/QacA subfamily drug resistance transporter
MTQEQVGTTEQQPMSDRNRWVALYVLCISVLMIVLDVTVVNVALPSIKDDLGFSQNSLAWVVNAYLITFGGLLLLAGRLGDLIGRRTILLYGLGLFVAASILCGVSQSEGMLIGARLLQGIGGAMTSAVVLGMIVTMFPEPREQAKAVGVYAFVASAGGAVGLLIGGIVTQTISWHWIFFINAPIGLFTAIYAHRLLEKDTGIGFGQGADALGAVLITASLMIGVYTIVEPASKDGWTDSTTLLLGSWSLLLLGLFIVREATTSNPLIPLRIFRSRNVTGANLVQVLTVAGMFGVFFMGSLYLQLVQGYDALQIGLAFLPITIIMGTLTGRYSEPLITRFGARRLLFPGLGLVAAGLALFTRAPVDGNYWIYVLPVLILMGTGIGISFPALMTLAMSGATRADAGLASGLVNTSAQVGGALGLAVLATLSTSRSDSLEDAGHSTASALTSGYHLAFWIAAGLVVTAIAVVALVIQPEHKAAEKFAEDEAEETPSGEPAYSEAA